MTYPHFTDQSREAAMKRLQWLIAAPTATRIHTMQSEVLTIGEIPMEQLSKIAQEGFGEVFQMYRSQTGDLKVANAGVTPGDLNDWINHQPVMVMPFIKPLDELVPEIVKVTWEDGFADLPEIHNVCTGFKKWSVQQMMAEYSSWGKVITVVRAFDPLFNKQICNAYDVMEIREMSEYVSDELRNLDNVEIALINSRGNTDWASEIYGSRESVNTTFSSDIKSGKYCAKFTCVVVWEELTSLGERPYMVQVNSFSKDSEILKRIVNNSSKYYVSDYIFIEF